MRRQRQERIKRLKGLLDERIVFLDGAMGTMIQQHKLDEKAFRGERFRAHGKDLKGNNDILVLTKPDIIAAIHRDYLEAGADIIETNTFNSSSISQADYGTEALVPEINYRAARIARETADEFAHVSGPAGDLWPALWGRPAGWPRCRRMSTIPGIAVSRSMISSPPTWRRGGRC